MSANLVTGVDIIEISRIAGAAERHGDRFLRRIYTRKELSLFGGNLPSLAARFAAKEAVAKALGCGIGDVFWVDIEVLRGPNGQPVLHLHGNAKQMAEEKNLTRWSVSLSHSMDMAIAMVTALGGD
jgi:holo-[acyl-carrier protein] synthase